VKLDMSADLEVIIVDNGSVDDTERICRGFIQHGIGLRYIYDNEPGLLTGRHRGAQESKGEILCFLDDDVILDQCWLNAIVESINYYPDADLFTGPCLPDFESTPPEWLIDFWYEEPGVGKFCSWLSLIDLGDQEKLLDPNLVWGLNFVIRRSAFDELKGFHPDTVPSKFQMFQGDGETGLTIKAIASGKKAIYDPAIMLHHHVPQTRLTAEYFGKRAFYQGVCDSYSDLRKGKAPLSNSGIFIETIKGVVRKIFRSLPIDEKPEDVRAIRALTDAEYIRGYRFHQYWFRKSPVVREWVLRDNYLDYRMPISQFTSPT
jgi:glycosyltransferase involved in cell wall biosynthesis